MRILSSPADAEQTSLMSLSSRIAAERNRASRAGNTARAADLDAELATVNSQLWTIATVWRRRRGRHAR